MSPTNHHNSLYINSCLKRNIDVLQTSLVCNEKKPSLQPKQALFAIKTSLVCDAKKPCLQTTDIHHDWESKEMELARQAARAAESKSLKTKKTGRPARNNAKATRNSYSTILNCRPGCCFGQDARPYVYLKSVIRPKQACCKKICLSFPLFSALVSSSCRRPHFNIARYAFNTGVEAARNKDEAERKSNDRFGFTKYNGV